VRHVVAAFERESDNFLASLFVSVSQLGVVLILYFNLI